MNLAPQHALTFHQLLTAAVETAVLAAEEGGGTGPDKHSLAARWAADLLDAYTEVPLAPEALGVHIQAAVYRLLHATATVNFNGPARITGAVVAGNLASLVEAGEKGT